MAAQPLPALPHTASAIRHVRLPRADWRRCLVRTPGAEAFGTVTGLTELAGDPTAFDVAFDYGISQRVWPAQVFILPRPIPGARPLLTVHTASEATPCA